jgi:hypothetical protein
MAGAATPKPKSVFRRVERWAVGMVMGVLAFFIERAVIRSIRKGETKPKPSEPTALKGSGSDIEHVDPTA